VTLSIVGVLVVAAAAGAVLWATGVLDLSGGGPLSQSEAEDRTGSAMDALMADLGGTGDGRMREMTGHIEIESSDVEFLPASAVDLEVEFGKGDTMRMGVVMDAGAATIEIEVYCTPTGIFLVIGEQVLEARPDPDGCQAALLESDEEDPAGGLLPDLEVPEPGSVTPNDDGTVTAVFVDEAGEETTVLIGKDGRVARLDLNGPDASGHLEFDYGTRGSLDPPAATGRMPAAADGSSGLEGDTFVWQGVYGEEAPVDEYEVHVLDGGTVLASFPLDDGSGTDGGFSFTFEDDGDGLFGEDDSLTIEPPAEWDPAWEVRFYDTWADAYSDEQLAPGAGAAALLAGMVLFAAVLRRRR